MKDRWRENADSTESGRKKIATITINTIIFVIITMTNT